MRVLIVEDELRMASLIRRGLAQEGLSVDVAMSGEEALWMAPATEYDAIVLDVMLPGISGFETCRRLRTNGVWAPVLMLTARDSVEDRVAGLDMGADDYVVKPFAFAELLARLRALVRRGDPERPSVLEVGELRLDPATRRVWRGDTEIKLSSKEFAVLETFMRRPDEVLSRLHLLEHAGLRVRQQVEHRRRLHTPPPAQDRSAVRPGFARDGSRRGVPVAHRQRGVNRAPIRVRVAAAFAVTMAVVLVLAGARVRPAPAARATRPPAPGPSAGSSRLVEAPGASIGDPGRVSFFEQGELFPADRCAAAFARRALRSRTRLLC